MTTSETACDVIVLGAGAAGLMCAAEAGKRGRRVVVLEQNEKPGEKILISGGGRCNFTNLSVEPSHYLSLNRHFCTSALARFTPRDFLALVERYKIPYHEKHSGQLFCDTTSREILSMRLNTVHNLYFYQDFFRKMRASIEAGAFDQFKAMWNNIFCPS